MILTDSGKFNFWITFPLLFCVLAFCSQVFAHAELQEIYPAHLDVLESSPAEFFVRYDEPVSPARIRLLNQNGEEVALDNIRTTNEEVRFSTISPLIEGQYILSIRVISWDAHPVASSIGFSIGSLPPPIPAVSDADLLTRIFLSVIQLIHLPVILVCMGLVVYPFIFTMPESLEPTRVRVLAILSVIGLMTTVLYLGLWGALINNDGIQTLFEFNTWGLASTTTQGTRSGLLTGGLTGILLSISLGQNYSTGRYLGLFGVLLIVLSFAASGHAASGGIFLKPVFMIHALLAGVWFGAIFIVYAMTRTENAETLKLMLIRFSERAKYLVGVLLVCAIILVWYQLAGLSALINSQYGLLLLLKIILVISVLLIAITNRWYFTPLLDETSPKTKSRLARSIGIETIGLFLIIAVTTVLASTSPNEIENSQDPWTIMLTGESNLLTRLTINPLQIGLNSAELEFYMEEEKFDPSEVQVQWLNTDAGIEPVTQLAIRSNSGIYLVEDLNLLLPGEWTVRVNVLIDDFTRERIETKILIE